MIDVAESAVIVPAVAPKSPGGTGQVHSRDDDAGVPPRPVRRRGLTALTVGGVS